MILMYNQILFMVTRNPNQPTKHGERSEASGLEARRRRASEGVAVSFGP